MVALHKTLVFSMQKIKKLSWGIEFQSGRPAKPLFFCLFPSCDQPSLKPTPKKLSSLSSTSSSCCPWTPRRRPPCALGLQSRAGIRSRIPNRGPQRPRLPNPLLRPRTISSTIDHAVLRPTVDLLVKAATTQTEEGHGGGGPARRKLHLLNS